MKFSPSQAFADYGHVILPGLAGIIGLAAISSQWVENHRLRTEVGQLNADRTAAVQSATTHVEVQYQKNKAYIKDLNQWIDSMNQYTAQMSARTKAIGDSAQEAILRRNAMSIVAMYQSGAVAGIKWHGDTKEARMKEVLAGGTPDQGPFQGKVFRIPNIAEAELPMIAKFISVDAEGGLVYNRDSGTPQDSAPATDAAVPTLPRMPKFPEI